MCKCKKGRGGELNRGCDEKGKQHDAMTIEGEEKKKKKKKRVRRNEKEQKRDRQTQSNRQTDGGCGLRTMPMSVSPYARSPQRRAKNQGDEN